MSPFATRASAALEPEVLAAAPTAPRVNVVELIFHIDIILLLALALLVVFALPRLVARVLQKSTWSGMHILRSTRYPPPTSPALPISASTKDVASASSVDSHAYMLPRPRNTGAALTPPPRIHSWSTLAGPLGTALGTPVVPGMSVGHLLVFVAYFGLLVYPMLYKSNPFSDPKRAGAVALSQFPIVFALAIKNNPAGMLIGMSYERVNYLHRFVGRVIILIVNLHTAGYTYKWAIAGTFYKSIRTPYIAWGFIGTAWMDVLFLLSLSFFRQRAHNLFKFAHSTCVIGTLVAVHMHMPEFTRYVLAAGLIWAGDALLRLAKTRICTATLTPVCPALGLTRVEVRGLNAGWRAGQHVRIRVLSARMGWAGWTEAHPFTVANVGKNGEGMVLLCKRAGGWTGRLWAMAQEERGSEKGDGVRHARVVVEGPYGGVGHTMFAGFSSACIVAGGSGLSFVLGMLEELVCADEAGASALSVVEVVWSVPDPRALEPFLRQLEALMARTRSTAIYVSVFYTRALADTDMRLYLPPGVTVAPGRPRIPAILSGLITKTITAGNGGGQLKGTIVAVCGPVSMSEDVGRAVAGVDGHLRKAVGGVELHKETFGF